MKRVKIGIVGLNFGRYILERITQNPANDSVQLSAVCDIDEEKAKTYANQYHVPYYTNMKDLLADPEIEAIGLFTGPNGRSDLIDQILDAGKHIMTTKPFELNASAAERVLKRASDKNLILHLNSPAPEYSQDMRKIFQWQTIYSLGRPIAARADVWARYQESADGSWYDDPLRCPVAPIFRLGIYLINDMVQILGDAKRISVTQSRIFTGRPTADNAQLVIEFANGVIGGIFASFCIGDGQHYRNSLTVNFENGTVYRNVGPCEIPRQMELVTQKADGSPIRESFICSEPISGEYQWDTFTCAIRGQHIIQSPIQDVVAGVRVVSAMIRAQQSGQAELV